MTSPPPDKENTVPSAGSRETGAAGNPSSYTACAVAGTGRLPQQQALLPIPTHGHNLLTVLIDLQSAKPMANRDDRLRFVLLQLGVDPLAVTSLDVEPVTQLYAVTFNSQDVFKTLVEKLRREVAWPLVAGKLVFG
jgi:hypothetical protein